LFLGFKRKQNNLQCQLQLLAASPSRRRFASSSNSIGTFANLNFCSETFKMPRAKQPLAEVDSNASIASNRTSNAKSTKREATEDREAHSLKVKRQRRAQSPIQNATAPKKAPRTLYVTRPIKKEDIAYRMKDNSVLRRLLFERDLSMDGTREEMISRLEDSSIDYESLPSE
jgi:hypothetical protein